MISDAEFAAIAPRVGAAKRAEYLPLMQEAMRGFGIVGRLREAAFIAQIAHETDGFHTLEEYASGAAYEGRADLGNTEKGDGRRFKGRGAIQLTGRANYQTYGRLLGLRLEQQPELAALPKHAFLIAGLYWSKHGLNKLADRQDFVGITRVINGGTNGLADRQTYYRRALAVLDNDGLPDAITVVVSGVELDTSGALRDEVCWVPLRETVEAARGVILSAGNGTASIARASRRGAVPLEIAEGRGYSPARLVGNAIGMAVRWIEDERAVHLD